MNSLVIDRGPSWGRGTGSPRMLACGTIVCGLAKHMLALGIPLWTMLERVLPADVWRGGGKRPSRRQVMARLPGYFADGYGNLGPAAEVIWQMNDSTTLTETARERLLVIAFWALGVKLAFSGERIDELTYVAEDATVLSPDGLATKEDVLRRELGVWNDPALDAHLAALYPESDEMLTLEAEGLDLNNLMEEVTELATTAA